jgi:protease YdgD
MITAQKTDRLFSILIVTDTLKSWENIVFSQFKRAASLSCSLIFAGLFLLSYAPFDPLFSQAFSPLFTSLRHQSFVTNRQKLTIPVAVFGKDQREKLPARYKKLNKQIGLLHNPQTNTLCTAFCVGPDIIATASHCLFSHRKNKKLYLSSFLFKLQTGRKKTRLYSRLAGNHKNQTRQYVVTGTSKLNRKPPIGAARDWALIRLEQPACKNGWLDTVGLSHLKLETAARNKKLFQVAYHMDYGNWQIAYSRSCSINRNFGGLTWRNIKKHFSSPRSLILHRCDTGEASSGSPLLMDTIDGPVVVGINVGTYQQREITVKNGRIIRRTKYRTIANTAVNAAAFSRKITVLKRADVISKKSEMRTLQIHLKERGYYHGTIDGIYGSRTERAIKAFERGANHPITGLATLPLLTILGKNNSDPVSIETSAGYKTSNQSPPRH